MDKNIEFLKSILSSDSISEEDIHKLYQIQCEYFRGRLGAHIVDAEEVLDSVRANADNSDLHSIVNSLYGIDSFHYNLYMYNDDANYSSLTSENIKLLVEDMIEIYEDKSSGVSLRLSSKF